MKIPQNLFTLVYQYFWRTQRGESFKALLTRFTTELMVGGQKLYLKLVDRRGFQGIIDKVHSRIDGWRAKTLSQVGRLVLLKLVAAAIPTYAMSSFLIPNSCCKELDRTFKNFWWGFPSKKN
jgi:hypothetical protein